MAAMKPSAFVGWAVSIPLLASCSGGLDYETPVKRELRDPESAEFSDVEVGAEVACGFVNSRNGYGGYAGRVPFVVSGTDPDTARVTVMHELKEEHPGLVQAVCPDKVARKISDWMTKRIIDQLEGDSS